MRAAGALALDVQARELGVGVAHRQRLGDERVHARAVGQPRGGEPVARQVDQRVGGDALALARGEVVALDVGVDGLQQRRQLARAVLAGGEHAPVLEQVEDARAQRRVGDLRRRLERAHALEPEERPSASSSANLWLKIPRCASSTFSATRARSVLRQPLLAQQRVVDEHERELHDHGDVVGLDLAGAAVDDQHLAARDQPVDVDPVGVAEADVERAGGGADRLVLRRVEAGDEVGRALLELVGQLLGEEQLRLLEPLDAAQALGDQLRGSRPPRR